MFNRHVIDSAYINKFHQQLLKLAKITSFNDLFNSWSAWLRQIEILLRANYVIDYHAFKSLKVNYAFIDMLMPVGDSTEAENLNNIFFIFVEIWIICNREQ